MNTYGELRATVADWLNRSDVDNEIPRYVDLAEREIYRDLRCMDNEFVVSYDSTDWRIQGHPDQSVSVGVHEVLPPNFRELSLVTWNGSPLRVLSKQQLTQRLVDVQDTEPRYFALSGRRLVFSAPLDSNPANWETGSLLEYTYYGIESLNAYPTWQVADNPVEAPAVEDTTPQDLTQTDDNTTRMFQRHPDLYLHGVMYYGNLHLKDAKTAKMWRDLFVGTLSAIRAESKSAMYGGSTNQIRSAYGDY